MMSAQTTLPIGPLVDSHPAKRPERVTLEGRWVTLVPSTRTRTPRRSMRVRTATLRAKPCGPICSTGHTRASTNFAPASRPRRARPILCSSPSSTMHRGKRGGLPDLLAHRSAQSRHRGRQHHVHAGDAADGRRERRRNICSRVYVFDDLGYRRYEWKCNAHNAPSRRAAERFGFTFEGIFRQHMIVKGRNRDTAWFAMLDSEWPARKAAYERWLAPDNFDSGGRQKVALSALMPKGNG